MILLLEVLQECNIGGIKEKDLGKRAGLKGNAKKKSSKQKRRAFRSGMANEEDEYDDEYDSEFDEYEDMGYAEFYKAKQALVEKSEKASSVSDRPKSKEEMQIQDKSELQKLRGDDDPEEAAELAAIALADSQSVDSIKKVDDGKNGVKKPKKAARDDVENDTDEQEDDSDEEQDSEDQDTDEQDNDDSQIEVVEAPIKKSVTKKVSKNKDKDMK